MWLMRGCSGASRGAGILRALQAVQKLLRMVILPHLLASLGPCDCRHYTMVI